MHHQHSRATLESYSNARTPKSYNANSTLLTMIHYASAHVWRRKAYKASSLRREYCEYIPRFPIVISRKQHEI